MNKDPHGEMCMRQRIKKRATNRKIIKRREVIKMAENEAMKKEPQEKANINIPGWRILGFLLVIYDVLVIHLAYFLALWIRFDCVYSAIPVMYLRPYRSLITWYAIGCVPVFAILKLYRGIWKYAGQSELLRILFASCMTSIIYNFLIIVLYNRMPLSYFITGWGLQTSFLILPRFWHSVVRFLRNGMLQSTDKTAERVMIIGAGDAGQKALCDLNMSRETNDKAVCFIDDDRNKWGRSIGGVPIAGGHETIFENVDKYRVGMIFIAIPEATTEYRNEILSICEMTKCEVKVLPETYQQMIGQMNTGSMPEATTEDTQPDPEEGKGGDGQ